MKQASPKFSSLPIKKHSFIMSVSIKWRAISTAHSSDHHEVYEQVWWRCISHHKLLCVYFYCKIFTFACENIKPAYFFLKHFLNLSFIALLVTKLQVQWDLRVVFKFCNEIKRPVSDLQPALTWNYMAEYDFRGWINELPLVHWCMGIY